MNLTEQNLTVTIGTPEIGKWKLGLEETMRKNTNKANNISVSDEQ